MAKVVQKLKYSKNYTTFSDLLRKMEQNRIGTDASVAQHISGLSNKNYVQIVDGDHMKPNALGNAIIEAIQKVDPELASPGLRASMERDMKKIASGEADPKKVLKMYLDKFSQKYDNLVRNENAIIQVFKAIYPQRQQFVKLEDADFQQALKKYGDGARKGIFISKQKKAKAGTLLFRECENVTKQMGLEIKEVDLQGQTFYLAPLRAFVDIKPLQAEKNWFFRIIQQ